MNKSCYLFAVITFFVPAIALGADFRCPPTGKIIQTGMNGYQVQALCGEPANKANLTAPNSTIVKEEWTYDFGPNQFIKKLVFLDGSLQGIIETGDYGYKIQAASKPKKR